MLEAEKTLAAAVPALDTICEGIVTDIERLNVSAGRPREEWKTLFVAALALGLGDPKWPHARTNHDIRQFC